MKSITITFGFSRTNKSGLPGAFSWLIRMAERTEYSHVYIHWMTRSQRAMVYEASGTSVRFMTKNRFDRISTTLYTFDVKLDADKYEGFVDYMMSQAGEDYGLKQAFGIGLVRIAKWWFNIKIDNPFKKGQVCSETVNKALTFLGYDPGLDDNHVGPKDIYNYLTTLEGASDVNK